MSQEQWSGPKIKSWGCPVLTLSPELLDDWRCGSDLSREQMAELVGLFYGKEVRIGGGMARTKVDVVG